MKQQKRVSPDLSKMPRYNFDTRVGIKELIEQIGDPQQVLEILAHARQEYVEKNQDTNVKLLEFVLFGDKLLERHGEIFQIQDFPEELKKLCPTVVTIEEFWNITKVKSYNAKKIM